MELVDVSPDPDSSFPTCKHCGRLFKPRHDHDRPQLHCSDDCRLAYRKASGNAALSSWTYRHSDAGREMRRLAKRRKKVGKTGGLPRDESFDRLAIFARDGWRCQLCGQTVQDSRSAEMDSATIRLRVPIQAGGRYSLDNCETACRQCNGRAAALVSKSIADPDFRLPRSLQFDAHDVATSQGPPSPVRESFGSEPATAENASVTLVSMSPQGPQEDA